MHVFSMGLFYKLHNLLLAAVCHDILKKSSHLKTCNLVPVCHQLNVVNMHKPHLVQKQSVSLFNSSNRMLIARWTAYLPRYRWRPAIPQTRSQLRRRDARVCCRQWLSLAERVSAAVRTACRRLNSRSKESRVFWEQNSGKNEWTIDGENL